MLEVVGFFPTAARLEVEERRCRALAAGGKIGERAHDTGVYIGLAVCQLLGEILGQRLVVDL